MTQPIQEPLTTRSIAYGQWRTNQLERRPSPMGDTAAVDFPYGYIAWFQGEDIVPNTGTIVGPFDEAFVNPAGLADNGMGDPIIEPDLSGSFLRINPPTSTDFIQYCWIVTVTAGWSDTPPASGQIGMENVVGMGGFFGNFDVSSFQDGNTFMNYAANGGMSVTVIRANNDAPSQQAFSIRVLQTTPGNLFLNEAWVEAVGVPAFPVGAGSFTP